MAALAGVTVRNIGPQELAADVLIQHLKVIALIIKGAITVRGRNPSSTRRSPPLIGNPSSTRRSPP